MRNGNVFAAIATVILVISSQAATITISTVTKAYWSSGKDPFVDAPSTPPGMNQGFGTYQIDIKVSTELSASDVAAGWTGLGQLSFSVAKEGSPGLRYSPDLGYTPYLLKQNAAGTRVSYTDPLTGALVTNGSGATASTSVVTDGGDIGPSAADYKYLYFEAGGVQTAIGKTLTQSSQDPKVTSLLGTPMSIGTFLVTFDYEGIGIARLLPVLNIGEGANLTDGKGNFQNTAEAAGNTIRLNYVFFLDWPVYGPEPASISVAAFGAGALTRRRRV